MYFLLIVTGIASNRDGSVIIKNTIPESWSGNKFDLGIYRDNKLILTRDEVHVGDQAVFLIKPLLFFAIASNFKTGEKFSSIEVMSRKEMFDLSKFQNGMDIILTEEPGGGKYVFTADIKRY